MDIVLAKTFLAVVETGSFFDAAEQVHVTQSTISTRIKSLENLLGKILFERSKSGARLTPAGQQFQKHAIAFIRIWEHARLEVAISEEFEDRLAIGGLVSLWDGFLLGWVAAVRKSMPEYAISTHMGSSENLMERLTEGTLDLAVMYRPTLRPGLEAEHLYDDQIVLVTSGDLRQKHPGPGYVFVNWGEEFYTDHALAFPDMKLPSLHFDIGTLGISFILDNESSGYFPLRIAQPLIDDGSLKLVSRTPKFVYPVYVVYPEERETETFEKFLAELRELSSKFD